MTTRDVTDGHQAAFELRCYPGAWLLAELIEPHALSLAVAAKKLHVTRQAMSNLLGGRAGLSAEMAIQFEKAFGVRAIR